MREQGRVLVRVLVGVDGLAERIELKESSGSIRLDQAALETIRTWTFVPARRGDETVSAWVIVPITFTLDG
jgi:protein TonB